MQLSEAIQGYLLFKRSFASPTMVKTDTYILKQFLRWHGDQGVETVDAKVVRSYLAHHEEHGLSSYTIRRHHAALSALFVWLSRPKIGLAEENPARSVRPSGLPKLKPKALSRQEIEALIEACDQSENPRRDHAIVLFLLDTGCRASEVTGLRDGNLGLEKGRAKVLGKRNKERYVYLGDRTQSAVWLYQKGERPRHAQVDSDHTFLGQDGYPLDRHSLRLIIYRLARTAGVKAHPHMFRHTAAIEHLRHGMDLLSVSTFARDWSSG